MLLCYEQVELVCRSAVPLSSSGVKSGILEESQQIHPFGKEAVKVAQFARKLNKLEAVLKSQTIQWRPQLEPVNSAVVSADSLLPLPPPFAEL